MLLAQTLGLFVLTALAEILGCYLPWLWPRGSGSAWLLVPAALSLAAFVWLLTLHPTAAGRVYAAYGGVYVSAANEQELEMKPKKVPRATLRGPASPMLCFMRSRVTKTWSIELTK